MCVYVCVASTNTRTFLIFETQPDLLRNAMIRVESSRCSQRFLDFLAVRGSDFPNEFQVVAGGANLSLQPADRLLFLLQEMLETLQLSVMLVLHPVHSDLLHLHIFLR